uniref:Uncharacterized protein n=2 Tax=viral metagenome TaxID=1070528 RepID=A0A6M3JEY7_9ZZZZ
MTQKTGKIISRAKALKISRKFLIDAEKERIKIAAIEASKGEKMKLSELAKKAARLPHLEFDWAGVEQWNEESFTDNINNFDDLLSYIES